METPGTLAGFGSVDEILQKFVPEPQLAEVRRVMYGHNLGEPVAALPLDEQVAPKGQDLGFDLQAYTFKAMKEQTRPQCIVRIGLIQNQIVLPTDAGFLEQAQAIRERVGEMINTAGKLGVKVLCLQECWHMPFGFCTREKVYCEFAESAESGATVSFCQNLARTWGMVIVCPILERDQAHADTVWNTAVVIGHTGNVIGKHRKNHIPRVGDFNESTYYMEGNTGHPVFETVYGKIAVNICYGRHHPMNWQAFGMNGAEIVFNPTATVGALSEPLWPVEGRNAAIANAYYVASVNRVGTETFPNAFTSGDGKPAHKDFGPFYGSSYVAAPDGSRTPSLARHRDGLMVTDVDLNLCRQWKDKWTFQMTARYDMYAAFFNMFIQHDFKPQVIRDPALPSSSSS